MILLKTYQRLHGAICRDAKRQETELVWGSCHCFIVHALKMLMRACRRWRITMD